MCFGGFFNDPLRLAGAGRLPAFLEGLGAQQAKELNLFGNESGPTRLMAEAEPGTVGY